MRTLGPSWRLVVRPVASKVNCFAIRTARSGSPGGRAAPGPGLIDSPPRGNTSLAEGWELLLRLSGMKLDDLGTKSYGSLTENAEAIRNRQAVAMGWFTTVPAAFMLDLGTSLKLRLLGVPDDLIDKLRQVNPGFVRHVIPKGTYAPYGVEDEVVTVQSPTILIASAKTPADVVYKITKAVVEGREDFARVTAAMKGVTAKQMADSVGMPIHPGAGRSARRSNPSPGGPGAASPS